MAKSKKKGKDKKSKSKAVKPTTRLITPPCLASYCTVLEAEEDLSGRMMYSVSLIFNKDNTDMDALEAAVKMAKEEKFGSGKIKKFKNPIRDGDEERDEFEEYQNAWFINASSKRRPGIIDYRTGDVVDTDDEDIGIYSGCTIRCSVTFFGFDQKGNKGVGCGLNNIQVLKRGDRLDGGQGAESAFEDADDIDLDEL